MSTEVITQPSAEELAGLVASRLVDRLATLQEGGEVPSIVLTGGSIADKVHEAVAEAPERDRVDWGRVEVWFGDERFVPEDSDDRNVLHARRAMLDRLPFDPARVHVMPPSGGEHGDDVDAAARAYGRELAEAAGGDGQVPVFDVLMLGIGPDGHCASLFPGRREQLSEEPVVGVRESPKPPPTRISLTMHVLQSAREVWWLAAGEQKAEAVRNAVQGADPLEVPAAGPKGLSRTLWLLDEAAASQL
jgi:6-phosphogluconolactonase